MVICVENLATGSTTIATIGPACHGGMRERAGHTRHSGMITEEDIVATKAQTYSGYCVKCKEKREFEGKIEVSKTGMNMAKGTCPVCGTKVNVILGKAAS
jgi:hypothetical protein